MHFSSSYTINLLRIIILVIKYLVVGAGALHHIQGYHMPYTQAYEYC